MIQLWNLIIDFWQSNDWSIILTITDIRLIYFSTLLCLILKHIKKLEFYLSKDKEWWKN